jgi:ureidoacrylate peracid hydrolase
VTGPGTAVLVVDVQNDFCHPDGVFAGVGMRVEDLAGLVGQINTLVSAARAGGHPVIWVSMEWSDDAEVGLLAQRSPFLASTGLRTGSWGVRLVDGLDRRDGDIALRKRRFSAFHGTELETMLAELGVGTVVVAGVRTDFCVESTVRDAFFRDLRVLVARDAVAGYVEPMHEASLRLMDTVFADVVSTEDAAARLTG